MTVGNRTLVVSIHEIDKVSRENDVEVQSVSASTEQQLASMEQIAASSQSLSNLACELQEAIAKFQI
jgi:methyl-accepting chemotaxis protein